MTTTREALDQFDADTLFAACGHLVTTEDVEYTLCSGETDALCPSCANDHRQWCTDRRCAAEYDSQFTG